MSSIRVKLLLMFLGKNVNHNQTWKDKFLLLFYERNYVQGLDNVTMVPNFIYNSDTFSLLILSFPCLSKSLRRDFLCQLNLADFKRSMIEMNMFKGNINNLLLVILFELLLILFFGFMRTLLHKFLDWVSRLFLNDMPF